MSFPGPNTPDNGPSNAADPRPTVAGAGAGVPWLTVGGAVLAGLLVFGWMTSHRPGPPKAVREMTAADAYAPVAAPPAPPPELSAEEAVARGQAASPPPPPPAPAPPALAVSPPIPPAPAPIVVAPASPVPSAAGADRRKAPALVVDFGGDQTTKAAAAAADKAGSGLNGDEQFAARVTGGEAERSRATVLRNRSLVIAQGEVIPAVLETALDSDLPGFARAVVSRDVRSFDGSTVLVPRGSRVVGQYRSGLAQGASRAFVIWTRILRPDGVSIQIGSPVTDDLGRAGLAGKVDRHFFERFSGAILMSVLNAGLTAAAGQPSTEVVVGSSSEATGLASSAVTPQNISPTIRVPQGSPILIFVGRDLDFTSVEGQPK